MTMPPPKKKKPAKAPPPPGPPPLAKPPRVPVATVGEVPTDVRAAEVVDEAEGHLTMAALRRIAMVEYTTDPNQCTIHQLQERPHFASAVTYAAMEKWSRVDKWAEARVRWVRSWQSMVERRMADALARRRIAQMESLETIAEIMIEKLKSKAVEAHSFETMAVALLKVMQYMDEYTEKISSVLTPQATPQMQGLSSINIPAAAKPKLTEEEAREAALTIVRMRRENMRRLASAAREPEVPAAAPPKGEAT